jgi:hypothetical protein
LDQMHSIVQSLDYQRSSSYLVFAPLYCSSSIDLQLVPLSL